MAVNFPVISPQSILAVPGVQMGITQAGIRYPNRHDLLVFVLDDDTSVSGVFTLNAYCAAPVTVCKNHLLNVSVHKPIKALIVNTGCANAGTGAKGLENATQTCAAVAQALNIDPEQVLPFSTGVILEDLPMDRLLAGIPNALQDTQPDQWYLAAQSIMTTDTLPKAVSKQIQINNQTITMTGISKGAGMIKPNMATMLGFIATDAKISQSALDNVIQNIARDSFNSITIDGDTSTNDSFIVMATGKTNELIEGTPAFEQFVVALSETARELAQLIVRDGEGATKFMTIHIKNAVEYQQAKQIAYSIAHSPLVKTAFFASDPNLGRILAAIGNAQVPNLNIDRLDLWLNETLVSSQGARHPEYTEQKGQEIMKQSEITITVDLFAGSESATVWTCDLSHEYISINADYRS